MAFIKAQKLKYDESGRIISGSAAIVDAVYISTGNKNHSTHKVRERLGKVLYLSDDRKSGIFLSPTRGIVEYDAITNKFTAVEKDDSRIVGEKLFPKTEIHTVFGDTYLILDFLKKQGILAILQNVFPKKEAYERVLCHVLHAVLRDGSRVSCDNFILKSFASYLFQDVPISSLNSDTRFFSLLGEDHTKMAFFKVFVDFMKSKYPDFGKACYVDSTPLPNDIKDNPFNALCSHGISASAIMTRLVLIIDKVTGLPVWYDIIPGNVLDVNTIRIITADVSDNLGIEIDSLVLDAGYVSKDLITTFHIGTERTFIGRMPAKKGYPYKDLYWQVKDLLLNGKYVFARNGHTYFGVRKQIEIFGEQMFAYVYVDKENALTRFNKYLEENEEEYERMKDKDKTWMNVKFGYFVLLSNQEMTPKELLSEYFARTMIESMFKTCKEYLELLPLSKWSNQTVRGKILHDIINTICLLLLRKQLIDSSKSVSEILGKCQSLMCFKNDRDIVTVETPSKQVKEYYNLFGTDVPAHVDLKKYIPLIMNAKV